MKPLSMKWRSGRLLHPFYVNQQLLLDYLGARFGTSLPPSKRVYSSCIFWCVPILLSSLQHLVIWNPNGAFEHEMKEWKAVTSLLWRQKSLNWLTEAHTIILYGTQMEPLSIYIEGIACLSLPFMLTNSSNLTAWTRCWNFNPLFEVRLPCSALLPFYSPLNNEMIAKTASTVVHIEQDFTLVLGRTVSYAISHQSE